MCLIFLAMPASLCVSLHQYEVGLRDWVSGDERIVQFQPQVEFKKNSQGPIRSAGMSGTFCISKVGTWISGVFAGFDEFIYLHRVDGLP